MHFVTFVVTEERPTQEVLEKTLYPFRPSWEGGAGRLDWFALGGRYTGLLIPKDPEQNDSITGGYAIQPIEALMDQLHDQPGTRIRHPGHTGPGVDALRFGDIKELLAGLPVAVVIDGKWHESPLTPELAACGMLRKMEADGFKLPPGAGFWSPELQAKCDEQEAAVRAWWEGEAKPMLNRCCGDHWLAIVDCHI